MDDSPALLMTAMMALALPNNSDTFFTRLAGEDSAVQAKERPVALPPNIDVVLREVDMAKLFVSMVNEGNMIDIAAWLQRASMMPMPGVRKWAQTAAAVLSILDNATMHGSRCSILKPDAYGGDISQAQGAIQATKESILSQQGVPSGINVDDLSWDAISFKTPPTAAELFCYKNPQMVQSLTAEHLAIIDQVQKSVGDAIREKCGEFRARMNTAEDEFLPDMTLFLEQQFKGVADDERPLKIARIGRGVLIDYVNKMQSLFVTGNLPSAMQPAKIYSCHDVSSATELRASIMKLSETQVIQQSAIVSNLVINRAYSLAQGTDLATQDWTKQQQASLLIKRNTDIYMRRALATMGQAYDNPMRNLESQLAGSSNTLGHQVQAQTQQPVVNQNEEQEEISEQQLSVLLACLRMRANAIQQSDWELMTDDDLDHLEIIKFLSHQAAEISSGTDVIYKTATMIQEEYANGHNIVKFQRKELPPELVQLVQYTVEGRAKMLLRQIPVFDNDLRESGQAFQVLLYCIMQALAQVQRIDMEIKVRSERKGVAQSAIMSM